MLNTTVCTSPQVLGKRVPISTAAQGARSRSGLGVWHFLKSFENATRPEGLEGTTYLTSWRAPTTEGRIRSRFMAHAVVYVLRRAKSER